MARKVRDRNGLSLILGAGERTSGSSGALVVVEEPKPAVPVQLGLWNTSLARSAIVFLVMDAVDFDAFARLIRGILPKIVVDMRTAPVFRGARFSSSAFEMLFSEVQSTYRVAPELANPFVGTSWNPEIVRTRYQQYLVERREDIRKLCGASKGGPSLLITDPACERELLAAFAEERGDLEVVVWEAPLV
jgi:hypothetical protein